jgi:UDP-N-acetylmuramyl pentapeptide phosphotransferase/UDP-N-acetylglucosamine-1-phosphate transferase
MEFEEMQSVWQEMSAEIEKQKKITDSIIIKMTKSNYRNKINNIRIPEMAGAFVCIAAVLFIVLNFQQLNNWYLAACGITCSLILILLPVLSLGAIRNLQSVNIADNNYKQSLADYARRKKQFAFIRKINFYLGAILLLVTFPVMGKLIGGKDLFVTTHIWMYYVIAYPFFYAFSKWVFKKYSKSTNDAENLLKELESL